MPARHSGLMTSHAVDLDSRDLFKSQCNPFYSYKENLLLTIKCIIFDSVSKILFIFFIANNNNYDSNNENIAP